MKFREYYELNEDRTYILMMGQDGQYHVISPNQGNIPQAMAAAKQANNPKGIWTYTIQSGKLNLPPELADQKEPILQAHYDRMGFNKLPSPKVDMDDDSDFIDPSVFNPDYGKGDWKKYNPQQGTVDYHSNRR